MNIFNIMQKYKKKTKPRFFYLSAAPVFYQTTATVPL